MEFHVRFTGDQIGKLADLLRNDSSLPALDAVALYCLLAEWNPRTFLAIGSGLATLLARESIRSNRLRGKIISIDPGAKPELDNVCDKVIRTPLQDLPADFFQDLSPGDVLFMDGSHRSLPNSDVTVFFMEILPVLKPWGLVHLHDIWLPWDYPAGVAEHAYSEQYLLATALLVAYRIQTVLPNTFVSRTPELLSIPDPIFSALGDVDKTGSSYWLTMV